MLLCCVCWEKTIFAPQARDEDTDCRDAISFCRSRSFCTVTAEMCPPGPALWPALLGCSRVCHVVVCGVCQRHSSPLNTPSLLTKHPPFPSPLLGRDVLGFRAMPDGLGERLGVTSFFGSASSRRLFDAVVFGGGPVVQTMVVAPERCRAFLLG